MEPGILILSPFFSPNTGGVETHLDDLVESIAEAHIPAKVVTCQPLTSKTRGPTHETRGSCKILRLPWFSGNWFHFFENKPILQLLYLVPPMFWGGLYQILRYPGKWKCIHAHGFGAATAACLLKFLTATPYLLSIHAYYEHIQNPWVQKFIHWLCRNSKQTFCLSQSSFQQIQSLCAPETPLSTFRYWLPRHFFENQKDPKSAREKLGLPLNKRIFLFVGRLIEKKGVHILVEAFEKLSDDSVLLIIGDGPEESALREKSCSNSQIKILGRIPNHELQDYYAASDCLVVPSLYPEGFGRVAMESLACGRPVIACNHGGVTEFIRPPYGQCVEIKLSILQQALLSSIMTPQIQTQCRQYAKESFSSKNSSLFTEAYRHFLYKN